MKAIIVKELRLIRKDMRSFFFLLIMPALFIVMFSAAFGGSDSSEAITLHVIDQDQTAASADFMQQMGKIMDIKADAADSVDSQVNKIKQGQISAVLVLPQGFEASLKQGTPADIKLYQDPAAQMVTAPLRAILSSIATSYRDQKLTTALISLGDSESQAEQALASPIQIDNISTSAETLTAVDQEVPGMTVMFVFFIMITMSRRFFDEKKTGLLSRIRSTNVKPLQYLVGMWVPFVLTVIVQCVILFAFGHIVYGLEMGDWEALGAIVLGLSIAGTGIGLGLSFIVPGEGAAMVFTQLIAMGGAMLGGLWVPFDMLPGIIQKIGHFTPQYWAQHSLLNIVAHGAHIGDVSSAALILLAFGVVGLIVAFVRLPGFLRSAAS